jgi:hypothetical protein
VLREDNMKKRLVLIISILSVVAACATPQPAVVSRPEKACPIPFGYQLAPAIAMAEQTLMSCPDKLDDVFAALVEVATHSPDKENAALIQDMLKKLVGMNRISETYSKTLYQKYFSHRFVSVHDTKVYNLQAELDFIKENLRKELAFKKVGFVECCNDREGYRKVEAEYARVVNFMENLLLNEEYLRGAS